MAGWSPCPAPPGPSRRKSRGSSAGPCRWGPGPRSTPGSATGCRSRVGSSSSSGGSSVGSSSAGGPPPPRSRPRRFVRRWVVRLAICYVVICLVMWVLENRLVYYPVAATELWNDPPDPGIQDVYLTSPQGRKIHAWWLPREPDGPVLLVCPGNAGNLSGRGQTLLKMAGPLGTSGLIFDYPGYGKSEGSRNEPNCCDAGEGAVRWLQDEKQVPPGRVI